MLSLVRIKRVFQERNVPTFHIQCSNKGPFQNMTVIPAQQNKVYDTQTKYAKCQKMARFATV